MIEKLQSKKFLDSLNLCDRLFELGELSLSQDICNSPFKSDRIKNLIEQYITSIFECCDIKYVIMTKQYSKDISCKTRKVKNSKDLISFLKNNSGSMFYIYFPTTYLTYEQYFYNVMNSDGKIITNLRLRFDMQEKI